MTFVQSRNCQRVCGLQAYHVQTLKRRISWGAANSTHNIKFIRKSSTKLHTHGLLRTLQMHDCLRRGLIRIVDLSTKLKRCAMNTLQRAGKQTERKPQLRRHGAVRTIVFTFLQ